MTCWQVATCTVALQAPPPIVAAAAPLFALYPRVERTIKSDIRFVGSQEKDNRWSIHCNHELLWQDNNIGNIIAALELALYRRVLAAIAPELYSIHAASICVDGQVIVCAGISGAGKSSLCTQALLSKAYYLSDEFALLAEDGNIHPFPRPLQWEHLHHPGFNHNTMLQSGLFGREEYQFSDHNGTIKVSQLWLPRQLRRTPARLHMLILPQFVSGSTTKITPIARSTESCSLPTCYNSRVKQTIRSKHCTIAYPPTACSTACTSAALPMLGSRYPNYFEVTAVGIVRPIHNADNAIAAHNHHAAVKPA